MMEKGESCFEMYQSSETEEESGIEETLQQKKIEKLESEIQASQLQCIESYTPEQMQIIQNELLKTDENKSDSIVEIERNESSGTSGRKRRSATVPVDYVALDK